MHRMLHGGGAVRTPCEQPTIRGILRVTDRSVVDLTDVRTGVACLHSDRLTAGHNLHTPFPLLHHLLLSLSDSSPRATVPTTETLTIKRFRAQRQLQCHCHIK